MGALLSCKAEIFSSNFLVIPSVVISVIRCENMSEMCDRESLTKVPHTGHRCCPFCFNASAATTLASSVKLRGSQMQAQLSVTYARLFHVFVTNLLTTATLLIQLKVFSGYSIVLYLSFHSEFQMQIAEVDYESIFRNNDTLSFDLITEI